LVVETPDADLSKGVRHLNGVYTPAGHRRHRRVGHLFQGSSFRAMVGDAVAPEWLATDAMLAQFAKQRATARRRYTRRVMDGVGADPIWSALRQQICRGDDAFVEQAQQRLRVQGDAWAIPHAQRRAPVPSIEATARKYPDRDDAIAEIYATGVYSYREISKYFGIHLATVGKIIRRRRLQSAN